MTELTRAIAGSVAAWVAEDVGRGDRTSESIIDPGARGRAWIEVREPAVVAGIGVARACFEAVGALDAWTEEVSEGDTVTVATVLVRLEAPLRTVLSAERTALNLLARLSGVATLTSRYAAAIAGTPARLVDTRKTTPGLRVLEKYAVRVGGGHNHRFGLDDGVLIKDNHIAAVGGITEAVRRARADTPHGLSVEVEVTDGDGLDEALAAGADAVLLDNMAVDEVKEAVARAGGKVLLEASGGITLDNVRAFAETGVDLISVGALTHSARSLDVSLEVESHGA